MIRIYTGVYREGHVCGGIFRPPNGGEDKLFDKTVICVKM